MGNETKTRRPGQPGTSPVRRDRGRRAGKVGRRALLGGGIGTVMLIVLQGGLAEVGADAWNSVQAHMPGDPGLISVSTQRTLGLSGVFVEEGFVPENPAELESGLSVATLAHSAAAGLDIVNVSIQGESERPITLTGIEIDVVSRGAVPAGGVYAFPVGGPLEGRYVEVDLSSRPPRIVASSDSETAMWGSPIGADGEEVDDMTFPWTVSLTDPLQIQLIARANDCDCRWTASVAWQSGSKSGTLAINDDGQPFRLVSGGDIPFYLPDVDDYETWTQRGESSDVWGAGY